MYLNFLSHFVFQVKNHLWVFVNCLIENPTFDSQTKENMTLQAKSFGSKCSLSESFANKVNLFLIFAFNLLILWLIFCQQVKNHLWIFVNCLIENPSFDSQTKENMTLLVKNFGSKCQLSDSFANKVFDGTLRLEFHANF